MFYLNKAIVYNGFKLKRPNLFKLALSFIPAFCVVVFLTHNNVLKWLQYSIAMSGKLFLQSHIYTCKMFNTDYR